jgi:type IV secretion system protein VirB5
MSQIDNPYLNNRKDWNEINGKEKANAAMWRMFALLELIPMILCICGMIYAAQLPDVVPLVFKEDASGGIQVVGIPNRALKVDNGVIANQLAEFVQALRQVPTSDEMRRRNVHRVKMMADPKLFNNQLATMMKDEYSEIGTGEQLINITSILPLDKGLWEIDWVETKNGVISGKYKTTINYTRNQLPTKNAELLLWNFAGIVVKDINISPVIGSQP